MIIEMKVPSPGESITEVEISRWLKKDGDYVEKDEELCEIDSDKATLTLNAESAGSISLKVKEGESIAVGTVVCTIDTSAKAPAAKVKEEEPVKAEPKAESKADANVAPAPAVKKETQEKSYASGTPSPAAKKMMQEQGLKEDVVNASGKGGRITKADVLSALKGGSKSSNGAAPSRAENRESMSKLRKKIAQRLVAVKNETAMLTTFNEVDMTAIMELRKKFKDKFKEKHGVGLGFMSFFTKAVTESLIAFPAVNAMIDGEEIVYHNYCDIGIAVSTPKGLMVPNIRSAETLSLAGIESAIAALAVKARDGKLSLDEMSGGTFTITNGGVFGSLMSTPIINPPQSAILGMHNIVDRPMAINGKVEIRPMMYVALSYDHRIIDGKESVGFLVKVKQMLEQPTLLLTGGTDLNELLLEL